MSGELKLSGKTVICPVCSKHTALEETADKITSWLCASCGFTSNTLFVKNNSEFNSTPKSIMNLKFYDKERKIYWIPTIINMPSRGLIFPEKHGKQIIWTYIPMVEIPENEQKDYPIPNSNKFYKKKLDADMAQRFTNFYDALKAIGAIIELDELKENIIGENSNA